MNFCLVIQNGNKVKILFCKGFLKRIGCPKEEGSEPSHRWLCITQVQAFCSANGFRLQKCICFVYHFKKHSAGFMSEVHQLQNNCLSLS